MIEQQIPLHKNNYALRITNYELFKWEHSVGENHWQQVLPLSNLIVYESILVPPQLTHKFCLPIGRWPLGTSLIRCVEHLQVAAISLRDIAVLCSNQSFFISLRLVYFPNKICSVSDEALPSTRKPCKAWANF